jgi:hypothetical protein
MIPLGGGLLSVAIVGFATLPQIAVGATALAAGAVLYVFTQMFTRRQPLTAESFIQEV